MDESVIKAIEESIAHWNRMIEWAKKQPAETDKIRKPSEMLDAIGEVYYSGDCALCEIYQVNCSECQLSFIHQCCNNKDSPWNICVLSKTWGEFVFNAEQYMLPALNKCLALAKGENHE